MAITARRWVITDKDCVSVEQFDYDPEDLGPRELAVEMACTAVSPGTECAILRGLDPDVYEPDGWCRYPWRSGYSGVGSVIARGSDVSEYAIGDRVLGVLHHCSHETLNCDDEHRPFGPVQTGLGDEQAALVRLISIASTAVQLSTGRPGGTVGVWGLGLIGNFAGQLFKRAGYQVLGVDPDEARRHLALSCGFDAVVAASSDPGLEAAVLEVTKGRGLEIAVDAVGDAPTTIRLPAVVRPRGQLVLLTHWRSQALIDATPFIRDVFHRGIAVHGGFEYMVAAHPWESFAALQRYNWGRIQEMIVGGRLALEPFTRQVSGPHDPSEAFAAASRPAPDALGVLVRWEAR